MVTPRSRFSAAADRRDSSALTLSRRLSKLGTFEGTVLLALFLSVLAITFRDRITKDVLSFSAQQAGSRFYTYAYNDKFNGGHAKIEEVPPMGWACTLPGTYPYPFCGFGLLFDTEHSGKGLNLGDYESISIDLDYRGRAEFLRIILKQHDGKQRSADLDDMISQSTIAVRSGRQTAQFQLADFVVAEWWKEKAKLPSSEVRPDFSNIVAIEFVTANDARPGKHEVAIRGIRFEREKITTEAFFGTIAACWAALVVAWLIRRRHLEARLKRQLAIASLNSIPEIIWSVGRDGHPDYVSEQWSELYGGDPKALLGRGWLRHVHPADFRKLMQAWQSATADKAPFEAEFRARLPDGSYRWACARARPAFDARGRIRRWYGSCTDVHDRVTATEALESSERLHRGILEASADCICILSADGMIEFANAPGLRAAEIDSLDAIRGKPWTWDPLESTCRHASLSIL